MTFGTVTYGYYKRTILILLLPFLAVVPLLLLFMGSISPMLQKHLLKDAATPLALLKAAESWYEIILLAGIAIGVLIVAVLILHFVLLRKFRDDITPKGFVQAIVLDVLFLGLVGMICFLMITSEQIPALLKHTQEDIWQVESGQLQVSEVWFNGKMASESLPGPYAGEEVPVYTRYRGIGESTGHSWKDFYVPLFMEFQLSKDDFFNEYKSVDWNQENTAMYRVYHTSQMNLVTQIEKIK